jgi:hypothetical protein
MTGVIFEDLIRPMIKKPISEKSASLIMKVIVVVIGTVCVAMVFVVENMGTLVQVHCLALKCISIGTLFKTVLLHTKIDCNHSFSVCRQKSCCPVTKTLESHFVTTTFSSSKWQA